MELHGTRNIVCPGCSNGSKRRAKDGHLVAIEVYQQAVVSASVDTEDDGTQRMGQSHQVDLMRKRWANCGECGHNWNLKDSLQPDASPWA